jgi:hypothetical protein
MIFSSRYHRNLKTFLFPRQGTKFKLARFVFSARILRVAVAILILGGQDRQRLLLVPGIRSPVNTNASPEES